MLRKKRDGDISVYFNVYENEDAAQQCRLSERIN